MIWIIGLAALAVWFIASLFLSNVVLNKFTRKGWINKIKPFSVIRIIVPLIIFMGPFFPHIILHYYQVVTMPFVCERLAGYQPYNPVKVTSIIVDGDPLAYLQLPFVNFTEWEKNNYRNEKTKRFPIGKYRFSYYPNGANECEVLSNLYSEANAEVSVWRDRFKRNGYVLVDKIKMCIGVQRVNNLGAKYIIQRGPPLSKIESGFGYEVQNDFRQLVNKHSGKIISNFQIITAKSPTPFLSTLLGRGYLKKECPTYELGPDKKKMDNYNVLQIIKGFFILE